MRAQDAAATQAARHKRTKLPRPAQMDRGYQVRRDPATGELRYLPAETAGAGGGTAATLPTLHVGVNLVEVSCNVFAPDGRKVRGLGRDDFRLFEDGVEQQPAYFDASMEPLHMALVLDASPSVLRDESEMKQAARTLLANLGPRDEIAVVAFAAHAFLELPFSHDRAQLERAIAGIDVRRFAADVGGSNIYQAVYLTERQLFGNLSGRKAIVLLTDGQDSGLGLTWDPASAAPQAGERANRLAFEDVARDLAAAGVELYTVSTEPRPRVMTPRWLAAHQNETLIGAKTRELGIPAYTAYLTELVRRVGGQIYFLREMATLADVYRRIAATLRSQYTLGYYPSAGVARPGWRSLRVELKGHGGARVFHRVAYYVPASR